MNKTCGECRFYHPIFEHEGVCTATSELRKTCDFTTGCAIGGVYPKPPPTNGDKIIAGGMRAIAEFQQLNTCNNCIYNNDSRLHNYCDKPIDKTCTDGIEAWLDAPAEIEKESEGKDE